MNNKEVVIIVPIYKKKLNKLEEISLQQLNKILYKYSICFIAPKSLEFHYGKEYEQFGIKRFEDDYFQDTTSYSRLMLSEKFYEHFVDYEYMLVYQLDAFVFSDQLESFCKKEYDYIGAPWPSWVANWRFTKSYVGNGGFSLRRIAKIIRLLEETRAMKKTEYFDGLFERCEDAFFAYCGNLKIADFKIAPVDVAIEFSMELDIRKAYKKLSKRLPFGCHGWYKTEFEVWKPYIEKFGYRLDDIIGKQSRSVRQLKKRELQKYLSKRIIRDPKVDCFRSIIENIINIKNEYRVWGVGKDGKRCLDLLKIANVKIECIYDSGISEKNMSGILVKKPLDNEMKKRQSIIIIATKVYELEIAEKLKNLGLKERKDFLFFDEIEREITKKYYEKFPILICQRN